MQNPKLVRPWYDYHYSITIYDKGFCWKTRKTLKPTATPVQPMRFIFLVSMYGTILGLG